jgi:hypothetical protein
MDKLQEITGIGAVRVKRITDAWAEQKVVRKIMVFLHSNGVGTARAGQSCIEDYRGAFGAHVLGRARADLPSELGELPVDHARGHLKFAV